MKIRILAIFATVFSILPFSTLANDEDAIAEMTAEERVDQIKAVVNSAETDVDMMTEDAEVQTEHAMKEAKNEADSAVNNVKAETGKMKHETEAKMDDVMDGTTKQ